jgi:hypothetical protein
MGFATHKMGEMLSLTRSLPMKKDKKKNKDFENEREPSNAEISMKAKQGKGSFADDDVSDDEDSQPNIVEPEHKGHRASERHKK